MRNAPASAAMKSSDTTRAQPSLSSRTSPLNLPSAAISTSATDHPHGKTLPLHAPNGPRAPMYPPGAANPKPHSTIRLDKHFIPARSSRHRVAVIALYRALIALASSIPLPADLTREWHDTGSTKRRRDEAGQRAPPHPLIDIVRRTFKRNRNDTSPRIVAPALHAGYRALGLLQDFKTSVATATTETARTMTTTTAAEHEVLTLLRKKLAERQRSVSAKLAWREARRTQRPLVPRPKSFPPPPLNPTRLLVRTSRAPTPEDPYPEPITYATPNHPLPLEEVRARYRRNTGAGDPDYVPPRNRFVPHVAMAGEFPFMRAGKRHHLAFTSVIRGKLEKRVREMAMFKRMEQYDVHDANTEDAWEGMLRRQAFDELHAGRDGERRARLEEEIRKVQREERGQWHDGAEEPAANFKDDSWGEAAARQVADRKKDKGAKSSLKTREDRVLKDTKLAARRNETVPEHTTNETDNAIDGMLWGSSSPAAAKAATAPPTPISTPTALASSSPSPSSPTAPTAPTTTTTTTPSASPTTAPTEPTARRIMALINEQTAELQAMEREELSATRFSHTTSIHGTEFLTARFRYARADYIARAEALRKLVRREKALHEKEVADSKRIRREAWEARMAQLHGEDAWRGVVAEEKRVRDEARRQRVDKMTSAALERVAALRSPSAAVRAVAGGLNGRGNGKEGVGQRDPDTWRRLRGRTETKGVPVVHVPYEWEVRGVDAMISDARARGEKPVKPREYPKAKGKDP